MKCACTGIKYWDHPKTTESTYDFSSYINVEGNYTFTVRALGTYSSQAGPWTDNSGAP